MSENLPLVDLQFGVTQLSGNRTLFISLLGKFKEEYLNVNDKLEQFLANKELQEVKHIVHTLKGVAGNLGMKLLHQASKDFENCLKTESDFKVQFKLLTQTVSVTLDEIHRLTNENESNSATHNNISSEAQEDHKKVLIAALTRNEYIPHAQLTEMLGAMKLSATNESALKKAIGDLDYPVALQLLQSS